MIVREQPIGFRFRQWEGMRELKQGDVLWTVPSAAVERDPSLLKSWSRCVLTHKCGNQYRDDGCCLQVEFFSGAVPPAICPVCGASQFSSYNVSGMMGMGHAPSVDRREYYYATNTFMSFRTLLTHLAKRRRVAGIEYQERLTAVMRVMLEIRRQHSEVAR